MAQFIEVDPHKVNVRPGNPNVMSDEQLRLLEASILDVGFLIPIVVRELEDRSLELVDGENRIKIAKRLCLCPIPAMMIEHDTTDDLATALRIGLNRNRGQLDSSITSSQVAALAEQGAFSPEELQFLSGFTEADLNDLLDAAKPIDLESLEDSTPDLALLDPAPKPKTWPLRIEFNSDEERRYVRSALESVDHNLASAILTLVEEHSGSAVAQ